MNQIFFYFLKPFKKKIIISILLVIIFAIISSYIPIFEGRYIIDYIRNNAHSINNSMFQYKKTIFIYLFFNFILYIICTTGKFIYNKLLISSIHQALGNIRQKLHKKIHKLPIQYFDKNTIGNIMSRINTDMETISNGLQQTFSSIISSFFSLTIIVSLMLWLNLRIGIIVSLMIPASLTTIFFINKKSRILFIQRFEKTGEYNGFLQEKYLGHKEIILYNQQKNIFKEFQKQTNDLSNLIFKSNLLTGSAISIIYFFTYLILAIMIILGFLLMKENLNPFLLKLGFTTIQFSTFQIFTQYVWRLSNPINDLSQAFVILQSTKAAAHRIFTFLSEYEEAEDNIITLDKVEGYVKFQNVNFGYDYHNLILKNINLSIEKHKMIAIVGPTGSGKTTMINLLTRFYKANEGKITIDGKDITKIKNQNLRKILGIVFQEIWLFNGTILENIKYGSINATEKEVIEVSKKTELHKFIVNKKDGYQTIIKEGAENLSQGEKQLITITRILLRNPSILILDEATSTIDTQMELVIQNSIQKLFKNRTSFIIAHRLSTIINADVIIVLQNGVIIEKGKHTELLKQKGFYYNLFESQFEK
ncbi:ABC transporter family protein [Candidatus Phytoplasma oryzae]|uniref:ABC transporter family protein n=1 Tax=Candidatus Phytoplasma oryzae TaxID=203274 RepID=A0A139JR39_9MOLU|nr:ABC transporter ATP-binding protein [Candidatus Phytoplasma oryzae]KXT29457.1 ABC transporter family protein [Candidatus Phytoplasma oryzae]RAM58036.1 multidrug ABC transporter permease [Candidatus Phytoplasma oryzae]